MATTIQSGRASSPLLTADVASRAEVYGGRGLVFDGASDYLDCGTGLGNKLGDNYSKDSGLTISLWFKADETNVTRGLLSISSFSDSFGQLFIRLASNELQFKLNNNWTRSVAFTDLGWNHIAVVYADTKENSKMYLNGTAVGSESGSFPSSLNLNGLKTVIGGFYSSSFTFNGSMADVKIHSSALTEAEITSQYLKPESVPSPSSLVAWYPMCESNPENPQSIVYDHSEKKLGSELITASLDTGSGITSSSYITYDGKMNINGSGQDFYITINNTADTSSTSFRYRLVVTVDSYTSGGMSMAGGSAGFNAFTIGDSFNDIIVPDSNGGSFQFRVVNYVGVISSMSLKKIEMGNHATTNFFGDDLTNGHGAFDVTTNWSVVSGSLGTEWSIGSSKATHATGNTNTLRYTDSSNPMVNGTLYQVDFTISGRTAGHVNFAIGGASSSTDNFTASNSTQRSSGGSVSRVVDIKPSTDFDGAVELISIKEVGISSSGFTTAQNEPVIPQIPLVKSNEKMLFNGIDNQVEVTNPFNFGASTDFSISFWLLATDVTQSDTFIVRKKSGTEGIRIFLTGSDNVFLIFLMVQLKKCNICK